MAAYVIASVRVSDAKKYQNYTALTPAALAAAGGKLVARGQHEILEGYSPDARMIVLEFPTMDAARQFYHSPLYQKAKSEREGATEFFNIVAIPGAD